MVMTKLCAFLYLHSHHLHWIYKNKVCYLEILQLSFSYMFCIVKTSSNTRKASNCDKSGFISGSLWYNRAPGDERILLN